MSILGTGGGLSGLLPAAGAGLMLDLCNHGVLMVGAKFYERGATLGQVLTFLIASPWNSFSLTLILFALIGVPWTLAFIGLSMLVALVEILTARGKLPRNPHSVALPAGFRFFPEARRQLGATLEDRTHPAGAERAAGAPARLDHEPGWRLMRRHVA